MMLTRKLLCIIFYDVRDGDAGAAGDKKERSDSHSPACHRALPAGYEGQVRPRSGLATKHGITVINSPGTVDADYRGELRVSLVNLSNAPFTIEDGERIAQLVVARHETVEWMPTDALDETTRGEGGWGSTGTK